MTILFTKTITVKSCVTIAKYSHNFSTNANNTAPKYSDFNDIAAYSVAVADYFMAKIMAIFGNGNTALNRYGFGK